MSSIVFKPRVPIGRWSAIREKTETEAMSREKIESASESPKMFMVRHLERIDMNQRPSSAEYKEWLSLKDIYDYKINPYLDKENSVDRLLENLEEKKINHIICSPFVRCIQTAILIANSKDLEITDKTIYIDYKLGEFVHESFEFVIPVDISNIYEHSKKYISENFNSLPFTLNESGILPLIYREYETDEQYHKRILDELKLIRTTYSGNILVVTHGDAFTNLSPDKKRMEFGKVYKIELPETTGGFREKYFKYKMKYLELKSKLKKLQKL